MSAAEAIDHVAIGHDLARKAGVNLDEDEYDRGRLPGVYSLTLHHLNELRKEAHALRSRGLPGDRFGAARLAWYIRNNEGYAAAISARAAQLGLSLGRADMTPQLDLFA